MSQQTQGYVERRPEYVAAVELGGIGTYMTVPMLKENEPIGAFSLVRQEVRPFTEKQIALVRTSPPRPSSPSRIRGCSMSCGSAPTTSASDGRPDFLATDRDLRCPEGHQPFDLRSTESAQHAAGIGGTFMRGR